jgi:transcriptional regulator with XRE-family HTH domain
VSSSPVVANWELVLRLRERREQLGVSINDLCAKLGFTRNYWSAIENERQIIPERTLRKLFAILEFNTKDSEELLALREEAKENGWWVEYSALFTSDVRRLFGLEQGAQRIREFETLLIPGLLQTEEYSRAIMRTNTAIRPVEVEQRVKARIRRQERLRGENPLELEIIISEAAIRQQIGGADVSRRQLDHLITMIDQDENNVEIRVIPFTATACDLFGAGTLLLLDFHSSRLPTVAWQETVTTRRVISGANQVRDMAAAFSQALDRTLGVRETRKIINNYRRELR